MLIFYGYQSELSAKGKIPTKVKLEELNIRNDTQIETWTRWYKNGEMHRFKQPVGKVIYFWERSR